MPSPATSAEFLDLVRKSGVLDEKRLDPHLEKLRAANALPNEPGKLAGILVRDGLLTHFQAEQLMLGKWRRFTIGKYKVLERLGSGGMGSVYLCEHKLMRRRVAVKVLPTAKASDPSALERFYREARAVAALDHPNIVHAYDIDQDENLHFLVMEYVDGASLQEIIKKTGPMDPGRAAHYLRQAAVGLHHAHAAGLVHRDIKPGNILVDRTGIVKVLDMGLARFFNDEEDILTKKYDENVLGTADYLAPEQALDSHGVDIRADIYSLGATFYFVLTGRTPFSEGTVAQKLIWHQTRQPKPIRALRPEVPEGLTAVIDKMMAKDPGQRYQTPLAIAEALAPWTQSPIGPPPEAEMPKLSLAAVGVSPGETTQVTTSPPTGAVSPSPRKNWQVPPSANKPAAKPPETRAPAAAPTAASPRPAVATPTLTASTPAVPSPQANGQPAPETSAADEESIPWEKVTTDTDDLTARSDNTPRSTRRAAPSSRLRPGSKPAPSAVVDRRRLWLVAGIVTAVIITILVALWLKSGPRPETTTSESTVLRVGPKREYTKIGEAIQALRSKNTGGTRARIVVEPGEYRERLVLAKPRIGFILEPAVGAKVILAPPDADETQPLLVAQQTHDVTIKGLTLDGKGRQQVLVRVNLKNPGLTLEDVRLEGFTESGVETFNCAGTADDPIQLRGLFTIPADLKAPKPAVVLRLEKNIIDPKINDHIHFDHCQFQGEYQTANPIQFDPKQLGPDVLVNGKALNGKP
jgi:serine/threonine protein kinase